MFAEIFAAPQVFTSDDRLSSLGGVFALMQEFSLCAFLSVASDDCLLFTGVPTSALVDSND
jgi:hypothetical protein